MGRAGMGTMRQLSFRHPNVIVVLADDMGWGDAASYGASIPTPNLDRLAREGMRFTDAHSSSAVCTPSRYGLLTGRYAWRGALQRGVLGPHGPALIEPTRPTIASLLRDAGYATGAFGKWHLGLGWRRRGGTVKSAFGPEADRDVHWDPREADVDTGADVDYTAPFTGGPLEVGFDRFFGIAGSLDMPPYCFLDQDHCLGVPDREKEWYAPGQRRGLQVAGWQDDEVDVRFVDEAAAWLTERTATQEPYFLYLATSAPHRPCLPPAFVRGRSGAGPRGDGVCLVDWMVGRLLAVLDATDTAEDTLVIVTSDNGATTRFPQDGSPDHAPNGAWRGQKADAWEGGHREPFFARWPGRIEQGSVATGLASLTDLLPTVAAVTGIPLPTGAAQDGLDILPMLLGDAVPTGDRCLVHHSNDGIFAVRRGRWKCIFGTGSGGFTAPVGTECRPQDTDGQLYDVWADPGESRNLWRAHPEVVANLHQDLLKVREVDGTADRAFAGDEDQGRAGGAVRGDVGREGGP